MSHGNWREIIKGSNTIPQPAGRAVVAWHQENSPTTEILLYVLAHALGGTLKIEDLEDDPARV